MNRKQRIEAQMFVRAQAFATDRKGDFASNPPQKGDEKFATTLAALGRVITDLGGKAAIQSGGAYGEQTEDQRVIRGEIEDVLRSLNRDAAAIATERRQPGLMDRFRMPQGSGDEELRARLRGFAEAIEELGLAADFESLGQEQTPASLRALADAFVGSEGDQGVALADRAGATARILVLMREGRSLVKTLHSLFHNRYADDAETLGAWTTASRVPRPRADDEEKSPAPAAPAAV